MSHAPSVRAAIGRIDKDQLVSVRNVLTLEDVAWEATARQSSSVDTLLLGCTHYPLLLPRLRALLPSSLNILAQGEIVAPSLADYLKRHPEMDQRLSRGGSCHFLTTDQCEHFDHLAEIFMGERIASERVEL